MSEIYTYHGMDITLDIYEKISSVVEMIAEHDRISFEEAYKNFCNSSVYEALQNTDTVMWSESAEYIVNAYYRQLSTTNCFSSAPPPPYPYVDKDIKGNYYAYIS